MKTVSGLNKLLNDTLNVSLKDIRPSGTSSISKTCLNDFEILEILFMFICQLIKL